MPQPPTTPVLTRELVRVLPFAAQKTVRDAALAAAGTIVAAFDIGAAVTDVNQLLAGANPSADATIRAIGPNLDAFVFSDQPGTLLVEFAADATCSYRQVSNSIVPASTAVPLAGLRIAGRFVRVTYTNTGAVAALVEFGVYVRSA